MDPLEAAIEEIKKEFGEDSITTTNTVNRPQESLDRDMFVDFNERNPMMDGGMLVQPSGDGSRPGYNGRKIDDERLQFLNESAKKYGYENYESVPTTKQNQPGKRVYGVKEKILSDATRRQKGLPEGKGSPGIPRPVSEDFVSPMKDPKTAAKQAKTAKLIFQESPVGKRLQWIANNGKNYSDPEIFIKAYEKHFKHKIGSKTDVLFNTPGKKFLTQIDNLMNTGRAQQDLFTLTFKDGKAFNKEELFKASIIQNNLEIKKEFKTLFNDVHKNVSVYSELGPEGIVERLNKGKLLKEFDFVKSGVGSGIARNSLLNAAKVNSEHLISYQNVRKPIMALSQIIQNLKNPSFAKDFKISPTTATKVRGQLENFFKGEKGLQADIKKINSQLGDVKFNNIFGGVNFEHTLAKQFGKDYKYLPRNYLLKGQFTTKAFNMMKKDAFDLPLIKLMKQYEQGKIPAERVQAFIDNFNAKTNGYADFSFNPNKKKLLYADNSVKYDLSRYTDPTVARQELIKNIDLTMSSEFQKGFKDLPKARDQLKLFKSADAKNIRDLLSKIGCPNKVPAASGGRIGYKDGPDVCSSRGLEKVRTGMQNSTPAQLKNFDKLTKGLRAVGASNIMKFGVLPEALFEGALIADKMASEGDSLAQGLRNSYLAIPFQAMGLAKTYEEGRRDEVLAAAPESQKRQVQDVFNMQDSLNRKNQLRQEMFNLQEQKKQTDAISDGPDGYVGDTQDLENRILKTRQELEGLYDDPRSKLEKVSRDEKLLTKSPLDLNIKDQLTMDAYNQAVEKSDADRASNILFAPGTGLEDVQIKKRMKELPVTPEYAKEQLQATGDFFGMGYTPLGINKLFKLMGRQDPAFGIEKVGPRTGKYNKTKALNDYVNYLRTLNFADNFREEKAGGGIAGLSGGIDEGPQRRSLNPDSQGLRGILKRGKNI